VPEPGRETGTYGRFLGQDRFDQALAGLAAAQHAVIALDQARELGLSADAVRKRAAAGRLHRIHRGVYSLVPRSLLTREGHWLAAVLACGPGAVLSHRTAAALHGLRPTAARKIDVTVRGRSGRARSGIEVHRSTTLADHDTTTVNNIPCTTVARTQLDLAQTVQGRGLERAFEQAEVMQVFDLRALEDQLARNARRPAARRVRALLDEYDLDGAPTETPIEDAFLEVVRSAGLPEPRRQHWILLADGGAAIRADFAWPAARLAVETDGRGAHLTRPAFERDRLSGQRLAAAGWMQIRATWAQIRREPVRLAETIARLLERRR
jgi:predicted transcriptional regulator of viral defense system